MISQILLNDHFLLGIGLAVGPAIILIAVAYAWFRYTKPLKKLGLANNEGKTLWKKIDEMESRQVNLREILPQEYVRKELFISIEGRLISIDNELKAFMRDCRAGLCAAGRKGG